MNEIIREENPRIVFGIPLSEAISIHGTLQECLDSSAAELFEHERLMWKAKANKALTARLPTEKRKEIFR